MKLTTLSLFLITLLLQSPLLSAGQYNSILSIGDDLPEFHDLPSTSGEMISSDQIKEDILVIVMLANHCPWVRGMDGDLKTLGWKFANQSVRIIGLSVSHREEDRMPAMEKHANKVGYGFDYLYDESQELGRALGATHTPEYFVFNKERKLVYTGALYNSPAKMTDDGTVKYMDGRPRFFYVEDAIIATIKGEKVDPTETRAHGCTIKYAK